MQEQLDKLTITLAEVQGRVEDIYTSVEKTRKYFLVTMIVTIGAIALPLLILPLILPAFLASSGVGDLGSFGL